MGSIVIFLLACGFLALTVKAENAAGKNEEISFMLRGFFSRAVNDGIISKDQMQQLLLRAIEEDLLDSMVSRAAIKEAQLVLELSAEDTKEKSVFLRMYNQFSLLNVIYFSGALLIMAAYTLLMTIAWERFGGWSIAGIMAAQCSIMGMVGISLWNTDDYQFVGGLLCTISTSMVPFTVYRLQRALNWWPQSDPGVFKGFKSWVRPGWVIMEAATAIVGLCYVRAVHFPFLLAPVAFSLWFLSMDLAPLFKRFEQLIKVRVMVSMVLGFGMMCGAWLLEQQLGSDPDFGFWLYLFGLIAFWVSLTFDFPKHQAKTSLYFLINICLVLMGSHLDRYTFKVFGSIGIIAVVYKHLKIIDDKEVMESKIWILKSLAAVSLFAQAIKHDSNLELVCGLFCIVVFNLESFRYTFQEFHSFSITKELYCWFVLLTNFGFTMCAPSFSRPLNLWLFSIDGEFIVSSICSFSVSMIHLGVVKYFVKEERSRWGNHTLLYLLYRLILSTGISFAFAVIGQPSFAWFGAIGVPVCALAISVKHYMTNEIYRSNPLTVHYAMEMLASCIATLFGIVLSIFFGSNILYLVCCLAMIHVLVTVFIVDWKTLGCYLSVFLILVSVPLQSKLLIAIAAAYIFLYLSYLAYRVFQNSVLFPLTLVVLGMVIIGAGVIYQRQEEAMYQFFIAWLPQKTLQFSDLSSIGMYSVYKNASFSFAFLIKHFYLYPLWPAILIHALVKEPVPYVTYLCAVGILVLGCVLVYFKLLKIDMSTKIEVENFEAKLSKDHGIVVTVSGTKEQGISVNPQYFALLIVANQSFWRTVPAKLENIIGSFRKSHFPCKLIPQLIKLERFDTNSTQFRAAIKIGTGDYGSLKLSRSQIISVVKSMPSNEQYIEFTLLYSNAWYTPYNKLMTYGIRLNDLCEEILSHASIE